MDVLYPELHTIPTAPMELSSLSNSTKQLIKTFTTKLNELLDNYEGVNTTTSTTSKTSFNNITNSDSYIPIRNVSVFDTTNSRVNEYVPIILDNHHHHTTIVNNNHYQQNIVSSKEKIEKKMTKEEEQKKKEKEDFQSNLLIGAIGIVTATGTTYLVKQNYDQYSLIQYLQTNYKELKQELKYQSDQSTEEIRDVKNLLEFWKKNYTLFNNQVYYSTGTQLGIVGGLATTATALVVVSNPLLFGGIALLGTSLVSYIWRNTGKDHAKESILNTFRERISNVNRYYQ